MLFMGERLPAVERAYRKVASVFAAHTDPREIRRQLAAAPEIVALYEIGGADGSISVTLRDEIFREAAPGELPLTAAMTSGDRRCEWPLSPAELGALGMLLPLLSGDGSTATDIRLSIARDLAPTVAARASEVFEAFVANDLLDATPPPPSFFRGPFAAPRVTLLGHSSLLIQSERGAVLVDPILRRAFDAPAEAFDAIGLPLDAIVCSHAHWDHCDLQTLLWVDKRTPILVPRHRRSTAFNPPMATALARLGFRDVREVDHWEPVRVSDFEIIPVPFRGEQDEPEADIDHFTYVIRTDGLSLYGGVDCFRDSFGDMIPVLERVRDVYRPTVAFLPISKMIYDYETGGVNGFCRFMDSERFGKSFQYTASAEDAARWVAVLQPLWACPYAIFAFSRWAASLEIAEFAAALRRLDEGHRLFPLRPMDALDRTDLVVSPRARRRRWFRLQQSCLAAGVARRDRHLRRWLAYRVLRRGFRLVAAVARA